MWKNVVEPDRSHIIWRIRIACCLPKATDTHSEFVILLFHDNNGEANASQCVVILTLPVLLRLHTTNGSGCGDMHMFFSSTICVCSSTISVSRKLKLSRCVCPAVA
jgi:hypothetical protein